ncbi:hypothetical protein PPACK8108_LOCUS7326 [Phakopsora pachyrhizi]|uniref:Uncharacterized protein n=1 Tax=Phakopsora pachyrhizi TaxID=170000 RepID=A0AAV0AUL9_PHAPC|nr:hypothetical protein PPACK8108_LOCUS7326 [Phakopsora pachyrhizi]
MTFTDDSDLSETLSSAGSTVPLPSSELGSRSQSQEPYSPSGLNSDMNDVKINRRRRSRFIKTIRSSNSPSIPTLNPENEGKFENSRNDSNTDGAVEPSMDPSSSDRLFKSGSLPPPFSENERIIKNHILDGPRSASVRGSCAIHKTSSSSSQKYLADQQHPCTSHGQLPLFEQPVLVQGARPRRTANNLSLKPKKSNKTSKPRGPKPGKPRGRAAHRMNGSRPSTCDLSVTVQPYNDDESSLTEQSSSTGDDSDPSTRATVNQLSNDLLPASPIQAPLSASEPRSPHSAERHGSNQPHQTAALELSAQSPTSPPSSNPLTSALPSNSNTQPSGNPSDTKSPPPNPSAIVPFWGAPSHASGQETQPVDQQSGSITRHLSEESALTPEPEEDGQSNTTKPPPRRISTLCNRSEGILPPTTPAKSSTPDQETKTGSQPVSVPTPPNRVRPPNIIAPKIENFKYLSGQSVVDRDFDEETPSATPTRFDSNLSDVPGGDSFNLYDKSPLQISQSDLKNSYVDDALDGEPITDDLMEYQLELADAIYGENNSVEVLLNQQEASEAENSAVDGVPVPESEDVAEELELNNLIDLGSRPDTSPSSNCTKDLKSHSTPDQEFEPPPSRSKTARTVHETTYEHDDHVRRREDALEAMVKIEIMFAQVRDRLYVERMTDVNRETMAIHDDSHPELKEFCKMLEKKRDARLSLANKIFNLKEIELRKRREAATNAAWTRWHEAKTELREGMIAETQRQMKQVEREKYQPDLRYNVEVQLLPRPIIPGPCKRKRIRKRARLELDEENEALLAVELHTAVAKRATVSLSTLTVEESWSDLAVMRCQLDSTKVIQSSSHTRGSSLHKTFALSTQNKDNNSNTDKITQNSLIPNQPPSTPEQLNTLHPEILPSTSCHLTSEVSRSPSRLLKLASPSATKLNASNLEEQSQGSSCAESGGTGLDRSKNEPRHQANQGLTPSKTDRWPTLDAVMACNTSERLKGSSNGGHIMPNSTDAILSNLNGTCAIEPPSKPNGHQQSHHHSGTIAGSGSHIHNNQIYPAVSISVNYH